MSGLSDALFISSTVHARSVELADGSKHELHFREVPAAAFRRFHEAGRSADEDVRAASMATLIAASLCEPDGSPAVTVERALLLKSPVMNAIVGHLLEVNGIKTENSKEDEPGKG